MSTMLRRIRRVPAVQCWLAAMLCAWCACDIPGGGVQESRDRGPSRTEAGAEPSGGVTRSPIRSMVVEFAVLQFSMPGGTFTGDPAFWKLCSGEIDSAPESIRLRVNGFHAMIGTAADRRGLDEFLDSIVDRRASLNQLRPDETRWVELELPPCEPALSVFVYDSEGKLHGGRFQDAHPRLKFRYEVRSTNMKEVQLEVIPELEEPPGPMEWQMTKEGPREVQPRRIRSFQEMVFRAKIPEGGFLLLGPTKEVYGMPLVGRPFFIGGATADTPARENIFIVSPLIRMYEQESG